MTVGGQHRARVVDHVVRLGRQNQIDPRGIGAHNRFDLRVAGDDGGRRRPRRGKPKRQRLRDRRAARSRDVQRCRGTRPSEAGLHRGSALLAEEPESVAHRVPSVSPVDTNATEADPEVASVLARREGRRTDGGASERGCEQDPRAGRAERAIRLEHLDEGAKPTRGDGGVVVHQRDVVDARQVLHRQVVRRKAPIRRRPHDPDRWEPSLDHGVAAVGRSVVDDHHIEPVGRPVEAHDALDRLDEEVAAFEVQDDEPHHRQRRPPLHALRRHRPRLPRTCRSTPPPSPCHDVARRWHASWLSIQAA